MSRASFSNPSKSANRKKKQISVTSGGSNQTIKVSNSSSKGQSIKTTSSGSNSGSNYKVNVKNSPSKSDYIRTTSSNRIGITGEKSVSVSDLMNKRRPSQINQINQDTLQGQGTHLYQGTKSPTDMINLITDIASQMGWKDVNGAIKIPMAESRLNPDAPPSPNSNGTTDAGLWQINSIHGLPDSVRLDPVASTKWAIGQMIQAQKAGKDPYQPWYSSKDRQTGGWGKDTTDYLNNIGKFNRDAGMNSISQNTNANAPSPSQTPIPQEKTFPTNLPELKPISTPSSMQSPVLPQDYKPMVPTPQPIQTIQPTTQFPQQPQQTPQPAIQPPQINVQQPVPYNGKVVTKIINSNGGKDQCVNFARSLWKGANNQPPKGLNDAKSKYGAINSQTPQVGGWAIAPTVGSLGHVMVVKAINPNGTLTIDEQGYSGNKTTERTGTPQQLKIAGYWNDQTGNTLAANRLQADTNQNVNAGTVQPASIKKNSLAQLTKTASNKFNIKTSLNLDTGLSKNDLADSLFKNASKAKQKSADSSAVSMAKTLGLKGVSSFQDLMNMVTKQVTPKVASAAPVTAPQLTGMAANPPAGMTDNGTTNSIPQLDQAFAQMKQESEQKKADLAKGLQTAVQTQSTDPLAMGRFIAGLPVPLQRSVQQAVIDQGQTNTTPQLEAAFQAQQPPQQQKSILSNILDRLASPLGMALFPALSPAIYLTKYISNPQKAEEDIKSLSALKEFILPNRGETAPPTTRESVTAIPKIGAELASGLTKMLMLPDTLAKLSHPGTSDEQKKNIVSSAIDSLTKKLEDYAGSASKGEKGAMRLGDIAMLATGEPEAKAGSKLTAEGMSKLTNVIKESSKAEEVVRAGLKAGIEFTPTESKMLAATKEDNVIMTAIKDKIPKVTKPPVTSQTLQEAKKGNEMGNMIKGTNESFGKITEPTQSGLASEKSGAKILQESQVPEQTTKEVANKNISYDKYVTQSKGNVKTRGFLETLQTTSKTTPEMKKATGEINPQTYKVMPNPTSNSIAQTIVDKGTDQAHEYVLGKTPFDSIKSSTGNILMKKYAEEGQFGKFKEIASSIDTQARQSGRGIQSLAGWSELSPRSVLNVAKSEADKLKVKLPNTFQNQIIKQATDIGKMPKGSVERLRATQGMLKDIAEKLPTTAGEWLSNYRYQNMLSSPVSAEKIGYGGLLNTVVTHPVDLFAKASVEGAKKLLNSSFERETYFSDIPRYLKDVALGVPNAWKAAVSSFSKGTMEKAFEEGKSGSSVIGNLRKQNIPMWARPFTSLHGGIYTFFSSLISGGERARLMANGVGEAEATKLGAELGDKLTLRSPLGKGEGSAVVQAIDAIGNLTSKLNETPVVGQATKFVAPFMRVSTNWAKLAVEHSPLNLIDNPRSWTSDKVAKAAVGSIATGIGAYMTAQDKVTWAPPTGKKEQDLFYSSGRKPYSVLINGNWVPMAYFGPFALSFAIPAAIKDATTGQNASKDLFTKTVNIATNTSSFVVNNTPLPAIAGFFNMINGDTTVNPNKIAADMASQLIPLEALQRYVANAIDPIYRQSKTFTERIKSGIPGMTQSLPAYNTPAGTPETRNTTNILAPYAMGQQDTKFESDYNKYINAEKTSKGVRMSDIAVQAKQEYSNYKDLNNKDYTDQIAKFSSQGKDQKQLATYINKFRITDQARKMGFNTENNWGDMKTTDKVKYFQDNVKTDKVGTFEKAVANGVITDTVTKELIKSNYISADEVINSNVGKTTKSMATNLKWQDTATKVAKLENSDNPADQRMIDTIENKIPDSEWTGYQNALSAIKSRNTQTIKVERKTKLEAIAKAVKALEDQKKYGDASRYEQTHLSADEYSAYDSIYKSLYP